MKHLTVLPGLPDEVCQLEMPTTFIIFRRREREREREINVVELWIVGFCGHCMTTTITGPREWNFARDFLPDFSPRICSTENLFWKKRKEKRSVWIGFLLHETTRMDVMEWLVYFFTQHFLTWLSLKAHTSATFQYLNKIKSIPKIFPSSLIVLNS